MKKMLLVFAHPDDESFSSAATIAKYVKAGWNVDLLCATRGEKGNAGTLGYKTENELGAIREAELKKAAGVLGISSVTFLGYKDGTLSDELPGKLEDEICSKMEELVPDCVITFDTLGVSNHPDHIRICFATTFAFQKYAKWIEEQLDKDPEYDENDAPKLYYTCIPESTVEYLKKKKVLPEISFDRPWIGTADKFITTVISCDGNQLLKKKALKQHISQSEDVNRFLSLRNNPLILQEYYTLRMHGTREVFMGKNDKVSTTL
jgi:LmbE family N-acetylglucosaminyl deacetylase